MAEQTLQLPKEGDKVGSGILLSLISTGGSAYIYKTWVESLEIHRAVKVMSPDADPDIRDRFQTEARINSKLLHPHIVQCFNFGQTSSGLPFLEMEYLSGPSLAAVIQKRGALPLPVALALAIGILDGLSYAHTVKYTLYDKQHIGLIHRDLKPANVVIASDGTVKLMDFGIARPVDTSLHTVAGTVPGTVAYMSPEACTGGECDFRSDIYQVGLCLYEFITGHPTFPQSDLTSLLAAKAANKYLPAEDIIRNVDRRILPVIRKCLQLNPSDRYQSAHAALVDCRSIFDNLSPELRTNQVILAFLDGQPLTGKSARLNVAAIAKPAVFSLIIAILLIAGFFLAPVYIPALSSAARKVTSSAANLQSTDIANMPPPAAPAAVIDSSVSKPVSRPAPKPVARPSAPRPAPAPASSGSQAPAPALSPDDALYFIEKGKTLYNAGRYNEAFTGFQTALKTPSTTPRPQIIRQSVYWSAKCNTALYQQGAIPAANYEASWRSVLNAFPDGSPEHSDASLRLQEVRN